MTTKNSILRTLRRTKNGFTVGEIFERLRDAGQFVPYSSVRARVYELANEGQLTAVTTRKDRTTGRIATTFRKS